MADETTVATQKEETLNEDQLLEQSIIQGKEKEIIELKQELVNMEEQMTKMKTRALAVHEKNAQLMAAPQLAEQMGVMDYELKMAKQFADSKAFPAQTPEQCYVLIQAGKEMNLSPIVSLNMLYIVNGHIGPYGDKMLGFILKFGYKVEYLDEDETKVTARIYNDKEEYIETATINDQIIKKSMIKGAASFALKNKLRFHAIRMIASFHLPHLFMGCGDSFTKEFAEWEQGQQVKIKDKDGQTIVVIKDQEMKDLIDQAPDEDALDEIFEKHKTRITKSFLLTSAVGARRKFHQSQND